MEIDIELYKIFYIVGKYKSITKAAETFYVSQPAVTKSIKKLESQLGMTLFIRTKRGVILTSEGTVLYEYVKRAMENIKIGENRINSLKKLGEGNVRIGIGTTLTKYFLMKYIDEFHKMYPNVIINIDTSKTAETLKKLENGMIDLAVITASNIEQKAFKVEYSRKIQDIFVADKHYYSLIGKNIPLSELNNYPLLLQNSNSNTRNFLDKFTIDNGVNLSGAIELASFSLIIEFAKIGMGIGFTTKDYVKKEIQDNELFEITTIPKIPKRNIFVLTKKDYLPCFSASKLIALIKKSKKN